ncbi:hypothetical protein [Acidiferrobacter sp.]|uniref:hypothetical protein n=1 Tax=Acidiferrobacter sp. TaxID=1872107 RepID=UPI0026036E4C|nr:hypothetical protein [Acidiferrobacter sp.]
MNLFVLDADPRLAAQAHHDVHCNKMATEAGQIGTAALAVALASYDEVPAARPGHTKKRWKRPLDPGWGVSHPYHPATRWAAASRGNFLWALQLGLSLCDEWHYRFDTPHGARPTLERLFAYAQGHDGIFAQSGRTPFIVAFDAVRYADCLQNDIVASYRAYYARYKLNLPTKGPPRWTRRAPPQWLDRYRSET